MLGNLKEVLFVASGDLRLAANQICWPEQQKVEQLLTKSVEKSGWTVKRAHPYNECKKHGLIDSQKMGMEVFRNIAPQQPLIIVESMWQYTHHVLAGLSTHKGPILTVANWSGTHPGLVGMLNINGSLTKAGVKYSTLWSENFDDPFFEKGLNEWLSTGKIEYDQRHVKSFDSGAIPVDDLKIGLEFAEAFKQHKAIMGVFDEGCMGMFNAIVPDHLLHPTGIFKERLSQSALYAAMMKISDAEARLILDWLLQKGMKFNWGTEPETELTEWQTLDQCKMYIAAVRIADDFGCSAIGIQYQQGLKDLTAASDLAEGLLNNQDRPPVYAEDGRELYAGQALPHFNEVDECAGIDGLVTYKLWEQLGMPGDNTLHDLRWGEHFKGNGIDDFVWTFLISGAVPASHLIDGYKGASSERQPAMYFRLGGGSLKGISKPGYLVWSRIYIKDDTLQCDLGVGESVLLSKEETNRRWQATTPQWPIMNAVLKGVSRDQMMGRHQANHIQVVYTPDEASAHKACRIKAAAMNGLGIAAHFCGDVWLLN
ncbi:fucose isomerase [Mucilaginibacter sp.]|uniref:fucose isomerase n=1 Tax=Mucilaginibacter sp. TaxID=1882438 RepID=UPI00262983F9|nr:fucose isomerase [Mucilaginibacter sp.]MDB4919553.1 fucose isomerase [Mucilaginibacter sp.]